MNTRSQRIKVDICTILENDHEDLEMVLRFGNLINRYVYEDRVVIGKNGPEVKQVKTMYHSLSVDSLLVLAKWYTDFDYMLDLCQYKENWYKINSHNIYLRYLIYNNRAFGDDNFIKILDREFDFETYRYSNNIVIESWREDPKYKTSFYLKLAGSNEALAFDMAKIFANYRFKQWRRTHIM